MAQATRERTLALMKEKDNEIERLKLEMSEVSSRTQRPHLPVRLMSKNSSSRLRSEAHTPDVDEVRIIHRYSVYVQYKRHACIYACTVSSMYRHKFCRMYVHTYICTFICVYVHISWGG